MFSSLPRVYKELSTEETIDKIRGILETYGLLPEVVSTANPFPEVYSCILALPPSKGGFSTNGKGRTEEYCLASAYAEFIERLQNGLYETFSRTMQSQLYHEFGFYYDPREKFMTAEEFLTLPDEVLNDLIRYTGSVKEQFVKAYFERLEFHKTPGLVAIPFHCSKSQKDIFLPHNFLLATLGSNGMAAGNSYEEACFQALCELMERWAAARVYYDRLTPPTVPNEYLRQFEAECQVIKNIETGGKYRVTVKDFSVGIGLPAVGIIVENVTEGTYRLNIGCDTSFQVALSRALTEVFQGFKNEKGFDSALLKIPQEDPEYFVNNDHISLEMRHRTFLDFTKDGRGVFPPSLFRDHPSYPFGNFAFTPRGSYRKEVESIIEFFHSLGHTVYIRNVSYLGFPSVFIYIPEVSNFGKKSPQLTHSITSFDLIEWDKVESKILRIKHISQNDLFSLASVLRTLPAYATIVSFLNLNMENGSPCAQINISYVLGHIWLKLGRLKEAAEAFQVFSLCCPDDKQEYYQAVAKYLEIMASGRTADEAQKETEAELGRTDAAQQACYDLRNTEEFFKLMRLPECPNCSECQLNSECRTKHGMEIARILYPAMKKAWIEQAEST